MWVVTVSYTNHRGETADRRVVPKPGGLHFGRTTYHPEDQWLLEVFDLDKREYRTFAMKDIHSWRPADAGEGAECSSET